MSAVVQQGEILWLEKAAQYVLVLSREFFNSSGMTVVCPVTEHADPDALHIEISSGDFAGIAMLEHLKSMDLRARFFRRISRVPYEQIQDVSDAVQGIFDNDPYSL